MSGNTERERERERGRLSLFTALMSPPAVLPNILNAGKSGVVEEELSSLRQPSLSASLSLSLSLSPSLSHRLTFSKLIAWR